MTTEALILSIVVSVNLLNSASPMEAVTLEKGGHQQHVLRQSQVKDALRRHLTRINMDVEEGTQKRRADERRQADRPRKPPPRGPPAPIGLGEPCQRCNAQNQCTDLRCESDLTCRRLNSIMMAGAQNVKKCLLCRGCLGRSDDCRGPGQCGEGLECIQNKCQ